MPWICLTCLDTEGSLYINADLIEAVHDDQGNAQIQVGGRIWSVVETVPEVFERLSKIAADFGQARRRKAPAE